MYNYESEKAYVLTDEGQRDLLRVRDFCFKTLKIAGALRAGEAMDASNAGDSWKMMSCVDRLVEIGDLREIPQSKGNAWQDRVFVAGREV